MVIAAKTMLLNESGQLHCDTGPAFISADGDIHYFINGERSRLDGPAVIYHDGEESFYIDGVHYEPEEYQEKLELMKNGKTI